MIKILHNPRCSKSRAGLQLLEDKGLEVEVINYLEDPLSVEELRSLIVKLDIRPFDLIRTGEEIYKTEFKDLELGDEEWLLVLAENPKLIERPIVINGDKAVVGRPTEVIETIL